MNKGFTLVEIILYIALLSILIMGIFSTLISAIQLGDSNNYFTDSDYLLLISNFHDQN